MTRFPRLAAHLCVLVGVVDVASALTPAHHQRLRVLLMIVPFTVARVSTTATVLNGVLLVAVARGLAHCKKRAWWVACGLLALSVAVNVLKGLDVEESLLSLGTLVALVWRRADFRALADPRTRWRAPLVGLALVITSYVVGLGLLLGRSAAIVGGFRWRPASQQVLLGMVGRAGPVRFADSLRGRRLQDFTSDTTAALGLLVLLTTLYLLLRPERPVARLQPDDERDMRQLLSAGGPQDSLGYFSLRADKSVVWSPSRKACVTYRVVNGVMLASGDPLGDPEAWGGALAAFLAVAQEHAWVPAVLGCGERAGQAWRRVGLRALEIGDEAVVDGTTFSLDGRAMRNVRQSAHRAARAGCRVELRRTAELTPELSAELQSRARSWRGAQTERGFSMALGRFADVTDPDCLWVLGFDSAGALIGLLHFVPWGSDGMSLDLMRRAADAENGLNELLITQALVQGPALGIRYFSLNFAVFRSALQHGARLGAGPISRLWRGALVMASSWVQIESLYAFNSKFEPRWQPRYVCYPAARSLPKVVVAALEAEAFLVWPRFRGKMADLSPSSCEASPSAPVASPA